MSKWLKQYGGRCVTVLLLCLLSLSQTGMAAGVGLNVGTGGISVGGGGGSKGGSGGSPAASGGSGTPEDVLFQDMKGFLGATNAANIEAAKILLYMLPPFYDITLAVASRMGPGEDTKEKWQDKKLRDLAQYNTVTKQKSDTELLTDRINFCLDDKGMPTKYCNYDNKDSGNDVLASSLIDTLAYGNDGERMAAMQYIRNLTNYSPPDYPGDKKVFQDPEKKEQGLTQDGIDYFAKVYKYQASLTMAQNALLSVFADRTRFDNFAQDLPVGKNGKASLMEMMFYEVSRRYMNQSWYDQMSKSSDSAMLREIANMLALQNYLQFKQYAQNAQIIGLLAAQLSAANQTALLEAKQNTKKLHSQMDKMSND